MSKPTLLSLSMLLRNSTQWEILAKEFNLIQLKGLNPDAMAEAGAFDPDTVVAIVMGDQICGGEEMKRFPNLKTIARPGVGYNAIDVGAASDRGIVVTRVTSTHAEPVAEYAVGLLTALQMRIVQSNYFLAQCGDWTRSRIRNGRLNELVVGIIGLGAIGKELARKLFLHDVKTLAWNRSSNLSVQTVVRQFHLTCTGSIAELVRKSDAIVLCLALNDGTHGIFNKEMIGKMKEGAYLVNVGRGPTVNEGALADAVEQDRIGGVALDVFAEEPPVDTDSFKRLREQALSGKNVILTGHAANLGVATAEKTVAIVAENVRAALEGHPEDAEVVSVA